MGKGDKPGFWGDRTFQCRKIKGKIIMDTDKVEPDILPGNIKTWQTV